MKLPEELPITPNQKTRFALYCVDQTLAYLTRAIITLDKQDVATDKLRHICDSLEDLKTFLRERLE